MNPKRITPYVAVAVFAAAIWAFFQFAYEYSFYYKEQNQPHPSIYYRENDNGNSRQACLELCCNLYS